MSGIVDPSTPERAAREEIDTHLAELRLTHSYRAELLDAYAAAVRARALADVAGWVAETFNAIPRYRMVKQSEPRGKPPVIEFTYHDPKRHKTDARAMDAAQVMDALDALLAKLREAK